MRPILALFLGLVPVCAGCFDGRQKGKFAVSSSELHSLEEGPSALIIVRGNALTSDNQPTGPIKPLIYWLIIAPGLQANGSRSESSSDKYYFVRRETWSAAPEDVTIELKWDRRDDTVVINGKQQFDRSNGNVFVVVRKLDGKLSSWQVDSIQDEPEPSKVLEHVRRKLPDNAEVTKLLEKGLGTE